MAALLEVVALKENGSSSNGESGRVTAAEEHSRPVGAVDLELQQSDELPTKAKTDRVFRQFGGKMNLVEVPQDGNSVAVNAPLWGARPVWSAVRTAVGRSGRLHPRQAPDAERW